MTVLVPISLYIFVFISIYVNIDFLTLEVLLFIQNLLLQNPISIRNAFFQCQFFYSLRIILCLNILFLRE